MGDIGNAIFLPDYNLEVYNRNGLLMHKGRGWDGLWNNAFVPAGTYFYKVKILIDGMPEERMNYVVVMYY
jgi:gliding motility-associated-like protein